MPTVVCSDQNRRLTSLIGPPSPSEPTYLWPGCKMLCLLMINSAARDLLSRPGKPSAAMSVEQRCNRRNARKHCASAIRWFRSKSTKPLSLAWCCDLLGLPLESVRRNGIPWQPDCVSRDHVRGGLNDFQILRRTGQRPVMAVPSVVIVNCKHCGHAFEKSRVKSTVFCSAECRKAARAAAPFDPIGHCAWCGRQFLRKTSYVRKKFCSVLCRNQAINHHKTLHWIQRKNGPLPPGQKPQEMPSDAPRIADGPKPITEGNRAPREPEIGHAGRVPELVASDLHRPLSGAIFYVNDLASSTRT